MAWVRLDDAFCDHPKFLAAGPLAGYMHICAIAWSNRNLQDGKVPYAQVERLVNWRGIAHDLWQGELVGGGTDVDALDLAERLVAAGLWEVVDGGYLIHDYHDYQPTSWEVRKARAKVAKERARAGKQGGSKPSSKTEASRKQNDSKTTANGDANRKPQPQPQENYTTPSSTPEVDGRAHVEILDQRASA